EGRVLLLPRVVSASAPLQFVRWQAGESLEEGPHGTRQPSSGQALLPDLILLPCLGFDAARHRLGYGGGYYDRTRALMPNTCSIGIAYEESEICNFKAQPHDLPLQVIVTPNQVLGDPLGANPAS
ncbi:MAG: 5-formyltetrahydrofolate cyclo-ligase, partial [Quisquiliibacterium sp.]